MMLSIKFGLMRFFNNTKRFWQGKIASRTIFGQRFSIIINAFLKMDLFSHIGRGFVYQFAARNWVIAVHGWLL